MTVSTARLTGGELPDIVFRFEGGQLPITRRAVATKERLRGWAEKERLRVVINQYPLKAALLKDVLQEQAAVADADNQYQQALLAFWIAKADFERALGGE